MAQYLIQLTHDDEHDACVRALDAIERHGAHFLTNAHWGCRSGPHSGWLIVDFESREEALRVIPPEFHQEAEIVELNRFTRSDIASLVEELETVT